MPRGGFRIGAGRPRGQGKYKEPTKPIRVPESLISGVMEFVEEVVVTTCLCIHALFRQDSLPLQMIIWKAS